MTVTELSLRPAVGGDAEAIATLFWKVRLASVPAMPAPVGTQEGLRRFVDTWRFDSEDVFVAEDEGMLVGFARFPGAWLNDLYVAPHAQGQGVGSALLDIVKARRPGGFELWVFQSNAAARQFYLSHSLVELESTPGEANMEGAPDVRMVWLGANPASYLRAQEEAAVIAARDCAAHLHAVRTQLSSLSVPEE